MILKKSNYDENYSYFCERDSVGVQGVSYRYQLMCDIEEQSADSSDSMDTGDLVLRMLQEGLRGPSQWEGHQHLLQDFAFILRLWHVVSCRCNQGHC